MTQQMLATGFLTLYAEPLSGLAALAKSVRSKKGPAQKLAITTPPLDDHGKPDYRAVPMHHSIWVEINRPEHPLHRQHVLVTRTPSGYRIAQAENLDDIRGTTQDRQALKQVLVDHDEEIQRKKVKEQAKRLKEDSQQDPFLVLAGGLTPRTRIITSPWGDEDEEVPATHAVLPAVRRKSKKESPTLQKAHDVSNEPRDRKGRWTKIGDYYTGMDDIRHQVIDMSPTDVYLQKQKTGKKWKVSKETWQDYLDSGMFDFSGEGTPPPVEVFPPALPAPEYLTIGDKFSIAGQDGLWRLSKVTSYSVQLRDKNNEVMEFSYPELWKESLANGSIVLRQTAKDAGEPEEWQKTKAQFEEEWASKAWSHRSAVFHALTQNKPVPPEVLADYPGMTQEAKHFNYDNEVVQNPEAGMKFRIVNPKSPDYGRIFLVVGKAYDEVDDGYDQKVVPLVKLDRQGETPVGMPFVMPLYHYRQLFPYSGNMPGPYADAITAGDLESDLQYVAGAYLPGDPDLPKADGQKVQYQSVEANDLVNAQARAYKANVNNILTKRLMKNKDFVAYATEIGRNNDISQAKNMGYIQAVRDEAQRRLDAGDDDPAVLKARLQDALRALVDTWACTSADSSDMSLALQQAAMDEFGLPFEGIYHPWLARDVANEHQEKIGNVDASTEKSSRRDYQKNGAAYRAFLRAQYDATQDFFQKRGIRNLKVYRGYETSMALPDADELINVKMQPLSSFSTSEGVARLFARSWDEGSGRLLTATVPVDHILSTPLTGLGCLSEREAVVLGQPLIATMKAVSRDEAIWKHGQNNEDPAMTDAWETVDLEKSHRPRQTAHVDADLHNADWTKMVWDLPPVNSPAFARMMRLQGHRRLADIRHLPVVQNNPRQLQPDPRLTKSHDVSQEARDARGRWAKMGEQAEPTPEQREPWQIPLQEYLHLTETGRVKKEYPGIDQQKWHKRIVGMALGAGKPVPHEVVADYPDFLHNYEQKIAATRMYLDPQPGDMARVENPASPIYGAIFTVLDAVKKYRNGGDDYVKLAGTYNDGSPIPPFWVSQYYWRNTLPSAERIWTEQSYARDTLFPYNKDTSPSLPERPAKPSNKQENFLLSNPFLGEFLAKPQKIRVAHLLANRLGENPDFRDFVSAYANFALKEEVKDVERHNLTQDDMSDGSWTRYQVAKHTLQEISENGGKLPSRLQKEYTYQVVRLMIHSWATSSADNDALAVNLQRAADDEFGLHSHYQPWMVNEIAKDYLRGNRALEWSTSIDAKHEYEAHGKIYRLFVREQAAATQELFAKMNITELPLYRGIELGRNAFADSADKWKKAAKKQGQSDMLMQPLSSFSTSQRIAAQFAVDPGDMGGPPGAIIATTVPVSRILATPLTGSGCLDEREAVVLGGAPLRGKVTLSHLDYGNGPFDILPDDGENQDVKHFWTKGQAAALSLRGAQDADNLDDYVDSSGVTGGFFTGAAYLVGGGHE